MVMAMRLLCLSILLISFSQCFAQVPWNGKKCAVALTYDDALHVHLDHAIPALDSLGLLGTFYISASGAAATRIDAWRSAAQKGHELGNHTLYHPCIATGRGWVEAERDLEKYTVQRIVDEISMTNLLLEAIDGKKKRTFAYPCGDEHAGGKSYVNEITDKFVAARGVRTESQRWQDVNIMRVSSHMISGHDGPYMINLVKEAMKKNQLVVFLFHGVGGEHNLDVSLKAHRELLQFLKKNESEIWTAPFIDIAEHVANLQK
jgi:peptidoglycan/xylan/chitin deacetylase (PgdA/CDA1 family)